MNRYVAEIHLEKPTADDELQALAMMHRWRASGGRINPGLLRALGDDFTQWLDYLGAKSRPGSEDEVPQTLYFLKDPNGTILGAVSLRHYLNHTNRLDGGHVGYGICPEHRGKGYGNLILKLAVRELASMGICRVLVTCDSDNVISQKVIVHNGGVLENQAYDEDGVLLNRYWIDAGQEALPR